MQTRPVLLFLALAIALAGLAPVPVSARGRPVVAVFEPDSNNLGAFPLPNHLLSRDGANQVPGSSGAVASINAVRGFSTAAPIYVPFSGTIDALSVTPQSVVVVEAATGGRVPVDRAVVTYADGGSVIRIDPLQPLRPASRYNTRLGGQGPLLSSGHLAIMGHSMGGILTAILAGTEPEAAVAVANVPGGKVRTLLLESGRFDPRFNAEMARRGIRPVTRAYDQYLWMYQTSVDDADAFNYGPAARALGTQVLLQEMAGEDVMPNHASEDLARSMGLTQVHPFRSVSMLQQAGLPFRGSALFQFVGGGHNSIVEKADGPTASVHEQALRYVTTGLKGKAEVIVPTIPIPDMHLNMPAAPGE